MECNRDEATRAKEIAEMKLSTKDFAGAKKFALKAQNLYPDLDGISQLQATLDIYVAAQNKINGESDFYAILGVSPSADDDAVRKHYRRLALNLHPDKNKSVGADGAFKHISEAWSLLSDKAKRSAYDQRRKPNVTKKNIAQNGGTAAAPPPGQNGFYNFTRSTTTRTKVTTTTPKDNTSATMSTGPTSDPLSSNKQTTPKTFWTVCHGCKMQYEYLRMYLHQNLLCPNCHEPFLAMETPAPNTKVSTKGLKGFKGASKNSSNPGRHRTTSQKGESSHFGGDSSSFQWGPFSKTSNPSSSAQAASMVQRAYERVKREREEAQAAIKREEALRRKKSSKRAANLSSSGHTGSLKRKQGADGFGAYKERGHSTSLCGQGYIGLADARKGVSSIDIRTQLIEKARTEIRKKLHEWHSKSVLNSNVETKDRVTDWKEKEKEGDDLVKGDSTKNAIEPLVIDVPDPDFHNFDRDRCETSFGEGQVWAAYDDDDGMPRHYALIRKVSSVDPFKINVCWLNSRTNNELDLFSGFSKAFGEFKTGKHEILSVPNYFSHKVNFTKLANGTIQVYPRKGDVWALYRYWSPEWNEETPNTVKHKYEIVEVDESDEAGFTVTPLVKVAGFKTVFHRHLNPKEARPIPEGEIFRFSHQIPSYLLSGQESPNAPRGCLELNPAATPDEFLQVIADVQEAENIDDDALGKDIASDSNHNSAVLADVKEVVDVDDKPKQYHDLTVLADVKEVVNVDDDEPKQYQDSAVLADVKEVVNLDDDEPKQYHESAVLADVKEVVNVDDER